MSDDKLLVLATRNAGKAREFRELLAPLGWKVITASEAGYDGDPEETGDTFHSNALIKAREVAAHVPHAVLSDDSGLEVEALGGAPGVYSARYAGPQASDADNRARLMAELGARTDRAARFVCLLCLIRPGQEPAFFEGESRGWIAGETRGGGGFGYDPLFIPEGETRTYAEMRPEEKNPLSHRGRAAAKLVEFLRGL